MNAIVDLRSDTVTRPGADLSRESVAYRLEQLESRGPSSHVPAPGTENDDTNPPRIVPHHLLDLAVGLDTLKAGRMRFRVRVTVINLLDTVALYNFLSPAAAFICEPFAQPA